MSICKEVHTFKELTEVIPVLNQGACYVAGPISGVDDYFENFLNGENYLKQNGVVRVMNPGYHPTGLPYEAYFPICYAMIDASNGIFFLHGWEHSTGANRELNYAKHSDKDYIAIFYDDILHNEQIRDETFTDFAIARNHSKEIGNVVFGHMKNKIPLARKRCEPIFEKLIEALHTDIYGIQYENDLFAVNPYYWGDDEEGLKKPNFLYKPTGFTIEWYKYPLRDAHANQDMSVGDFHKIINECIHSIKLS